MQILAVADEELADRFAQFKQGLEAKIAAKDARLQESIRHHAS